MRARCFSPSNGCGVTSTGDREAPAVRRQVVTVVEGVDPLLGPDGVGLHLVALAGPVERKVVRRAVRIQAERRYRVFRRGDCRLPPVVLKRRSPGSRAAALRRGSLWRLRRGCRGWKVGGRPCRRSHSHCRRSHCRRRRSPGPCRRTHGCGTGCRTLCSRGLWVSSGLGRERRVGGPGSLGCRRCAGSCLWRRWICRLHRRRRGFGRGSILPYVEFGHDQDRGHCHHRHHGHRCGGRQDRTPTPTTPVEPRPAGLVEARLQPLPRVLRSPKMLGLRGEVVSKHPLNSSVERIVTGHHESSLASCPSSSRRRPSAR